VPSEMQTGGPTVRDAGNGRAGETMRGEAASELEALFRDSAPRLWRAIYGFVGGRRDVAEDAVAETFARAIEHFAEIRDPLPWMYRTAFRIASRELKRERRQLPIVPDPAPGLDPGEIQDVIRALATLSRNQRAAVLLHDEEGFPASEVAKLLGMAVPTVRVHLFRGRRRLRELLGAEEEIDD
jgi:RNA polymerase sigma-70 factor, ECF subfamily